MLDTCEHCGGFVPETVSECPNCARPSLARRLLKVAGGGAVAVTLMACYGAAPQMTQVPEGQPATQPCGPNDLDQDGSCAPADCNDQDPLVRPTADDPPGDGVDQNCDGVDGVASAAVPPA